MGRTKGSKGTKGTKGCFTGALHVRSGREWSASLVLRGWEALVARELGFARGKAGGFLGMGRTKGSKGTKGCFTGAKLL